MPKEALVETTSDERTIQHAEFTKIMGEDLNRLGQRNLYWFRRGTYRSAVAPWLVSESQRATILEQARLEDPDPANFDLIGAIHKAYYKLHDLELEKLKKRVNAYEASNHFMRFLKWLFTGIGRDLELLCYYHYRHLNFQLFLSKDPRKTWSSYIDEFLNDRVSEDQGVQSPATDTHPARDIRYLSRLSPLRPVGQKILSYLSVLRGSPPSNSAGATSTRARSPARKFARAIRDYGPVENWREILGVGEGADLKAINSAFKAARVIFPRYDDESLIRLYAAYRHGITSLGLIDVEILSMLRNRDLEEVQEEYALNAEVYPTLVETSVRRLHPTAVIQTIIERSVQNSGSRRAAKNIYSLCVRAWDAEIRRGHVVDSIPRIDESLSREVLYQQELALCRWEGDSDPFKSWWKSQNTDSLKQAKDQLNLFSSDPRRNLLLFFQLVEALSRSLKSSDQRRLNFPTMFQAGISNVVEETGAAGVVDFFSGFSHGSSTNA